MNGHTFGSLAIQTPQHRVRMDGKKIPRISMAGFSVQSWLLKAVIMILSGETTLTIIHGMPNMAISQGIRPEIIGQHRVPTKSLSLLYEQYFLSADCLLFTFRLCICMSSQNLGRTIILYKSSGTILEADSRSTNSFCACP